MIYKFNHYTSELEVELLQEEKEAIQLSIKTERDNIWNNIYLSKKEVFHLIGALHLLHKEMK
jgi:hypothetical protein